MIKEFSVCKSNDSRRIISA